MIGQPITQVNGVGLACEVSGSGEPVLLIHGLGGSRADWRPQLDALSSRYCVVRYDIRGHGESDKPRRSYSLPALANDAAGLIRELGLGAAHVVGLSLGGMIGFQLAVDSPQLVRSLTIVNSMPEVIGRTPREKLKLATRLFLTWLLGPRRLAKLLVRRLFPKPEQEPLRRDFLSRMVGNDRHAYLATTRAIMGWSVADRLPEVRCPVLVVSGDRDYTPVSRKEEYVRRLPDAQLAVIADSGHATPIDRPEEFNQRLLRFLDGA
jgi:pimeloyl-ACP methyl ester carboxylesterase